MAICEKLLEVKDWKMYNSHTCIYIYTHMCVLCIYTQYFEEPKPPHFVKKDSILEF